MIAGLQMFVSVLWRRIRLKRFNQSEWLQMGYATKLVTKPFQERK